MSKWPSYYKILTQSLQSLLRRWWLLVLLLLLVQCLFCNAFYSVSTPSLPNPSAPSIPFYLGNGNFLIIIDSYAIVEITSAWPSPFCTAYWVIHWKVACGGEGWGVKELKGVKEVMGHMGVPGVSDWFSLCSVLALFGLDAVPCPSLSIPIHPYPYPHQPSMRSSMHNCYGN